MGFLTQISKESYDAVTETDPNNLVFSSSYNTLKYDISGNNILTIDYSNYYLTDVDVFGTFYSHRAIGTVAHNLGYKPFFIVDTETLTDKYSLCPYQFSDVGFKIFLQSYVDNTNLYFVAEIRNQATSGTIGYTFYYKIFKNDTGL